MKTEKYQKIKRILILIILSILGFGLLLAFIVGLILGLGSDEFEDYRKEFKEKKLFKANADSVWTHDFNTFCAKGSIKFRLFAVEKMTAYKMILEPDSLYCFPQEKGSITVRLEDRDGFVVSEFSPEDYVTLNDKKGNTTGREYTGKIYLDIIDFISHKSISVAHSIDIYNKYEKAAKRNVKETKKVNSRFEDNMEAWTKKSKNIKVGMTYSEMIKVAGEPRLSAVVTPMQEIIENYDRYKYNYGKYWVYFKDGLVAGFDEK